MSNMKKAGGWLLVLGLVLMDQLSKIMVVSNLNIGEVIKIIPNFFYLTYLENTGAAWSLFQNGRYFFIVFTIILISVIGYILTKKIEPLLHFSLLLVLSGAIGNLIDRVLKGSVTDFIGILLGNYHYPIFNLADCFVVIGMFILTYFVFFIAK
jgi:signal peptidase II